MKLKTILEHPGPRFILRTSTGSMRLLVSNLYSDRCSICYCNLQKRNYLYEAEKTSGFHLKNHRSLAAVRRFERRFFPPVNSKFRHKTEVFIIFHQNDQKHGMNFIIFNAIFRVARHGKYGIIYNMNNELLCTFGRCNYG